MIALLSGVSHAPAAGPSESDSASEEDSSSSQCIEPITTRAACPGGSGGSRGGARGGSAGGGSEGVCEEPS